MQVGMRGSTQTQNVFNTEKPFLTSHTSIYLVHTIQPNSPFNLMVSFSHLRYNVIQRGWGAILGQNYKIVQNLPYLLDYFNYFCQL